MPHTHRHMMMVGGGGGTHMKEFSSLGCGERFKSNKKESLLLINFNLLRFRSSSHEYALGVNDSTISLKSGSLIGGGGGVR
jgi:hypothetical protein